MSAEPSIFEDPIQLRIMNRPRGRGSASSRIIASARATAGRGVGMTATSIPSLSQRSQLIVSPSNTSGGISRSNSLSSPPVTNPTNRSGDSSSDGTINSVHELCTGILNKMNGFDNRLKAMEEKQLKLSDAIKELHDTMKKMSKESFAIKGTPYEVSLIFLEVRPKLILIIAIVVHRHH